MPREPRHEGRLSPVRLQHAPDWTHHERLKKSGVNAWGLAFNPSGVEWVSANGTGLSEVYDEEGNHVIPRDELSRGNRNTLVIDGLWALKFGPGAGGFETNDLYFTAGPDDESHGVFGELELQLPSH